MPVLLCIIEQVAGAGYDPVGVSISFIRARESLLPHKHTLTTELSTSRRGTCNILHRYKIVSQLRLLMSETARTVVLQLTEDGISFKRRLNRRRGTRKSAGIISKVTKGSFFY